jgi:8-oxo-dGTP diphosphatase
MEVVAAIICMNGKVLCMRRGLGKYLYLQNKYEFPGGKMEKGETQIEALKREIKEEMGYELNVTESDFFMTVEHQYPDFDITLHTYLCKVSSLDFEQREHIGHRWLTPKNLAKVDWAAADTDILEKLSNITL